MNHPPAVVVPENVQRIYVVLARAEADLAVLAQVKLAEMTVLVRNPPLLRDQHTSEFWSRLGRHREKFVLTSETHEDAATLDALRGLFCGRVFGCCESGWRTITLEPGDFILVLHPHESPRSNKAIAQWALYTGLCIPVTNLIDSGVMHVSVSVETPMRGGNGGYEQESSMN